MVTLSWPAGMTGRSEMASQQVRALLGAPGLSQVVLYFLPSTSISWKWGPGKLWRGSG